jgi:hypothetical protein
MLLFEGHQMAVADLRYPGNSVQRDPAELPFLPQCIAKITHNHTHGFTRPFRWKKGVRPAKDEAAPVKKRSTTDLQQDAMACRYPVADPTPTFSTIRPLSCEGQKQIASALSFVQTTASLELLDECSP